MAVFFSIHLSTIATTIPIRNRALICRAALSCGTVTPASEINGGQSRRGWLNVGFPQEKGQPGAEEHHRDSHRDIIDPLVAAEPTVQGAEHRAD